MEIRAEQARRGKRKHLPRCQRSFAYFLRHFVWVDNGGGEKLRPWGWQVDLARGLPRFKRILTLKARQLGISWLAAAYSLWKALFHRGALVLLVSQTEDDAIELLAKVQFIYDHLPDWMRPERWKSNTRCLKFADLRSAVVALPSTPRAGRGRTASLVIADEHALHTWAAANYNALSPTIDAGGQFWSISTADGVGNFFAELCDLASANRGWCRPAPGAGDPWRLAKQLREWRGRLAHDPDAWLPLFLPYEIRPGREAGWWERKRAAHPRPREFFQEYPRDPDEAFVQTGRPVFDKSYLDQHRALCSDPLPKEKWPGALAGWRDSELRIFALPQPGHRYFAGADVAEGLEHGDYSDLSVFDADADPARPVEVLSLHGHWPPEGFARLVTAVARLYPGVYGIERNNHGGTVLLKCREYGMPGLFRERPLLNRQGQEIEPGKPGWLTSSVTKPVMIDDLEEALRKHHLALRDALAVPELVFYQTLKDGSTGAPHGKCDDRVMSRAIALQMRKYLPARDDTEYGDPVAPILSLGASL